jgi:hypothetical protein
MEIEMKPKENKDHPPIYEKMLVLKSFNRC